MKQDILKIVSKIKSNLKIVDDDGISHPLLDAIYDNISEIEEIIYNDDLNQDYGLEPEESFE